MIGGKLRYSIGLFYIYKNVQINSSGSYKSYSVCE